MEGTPIVRKEILSAQVLKAAQSDEELAFARKLAQVIESSQKEIKLKGLLRWIGLKVDSSTHIPNFVKRISFWLF